MLLWRVESRRQEALRTSVSGLRGRRSGRQTGRRCWQRLRGRRRTLLLRRGCIGVATIRHAWSPVHERSNTAWSPAIAVHDWHRSTWRAPGERQWLYDWLNVMLPSLRCQHSLCLVTVPFSFSILLVRILDRYFLIHQVLSVHVSYSLVRSLEIRERDESIALGKIGVITSDLLSIRDLENRFVSRTCLWRSNQTPKSAKGIVQGLLGDHRI